MGDTLWVDVRGRAGDDLPRDNSIMLRLQSQLDGLAARLIVSKLSDFYDYSEMEAAYGDFGEENEATDDAPDAGDNPPGGEWYDPRPALAAVRAIHAHLSEHSADLGFHPDPSRAHWPAALMDELADCLAVLQSAADQGRPFRFLIVP
jgi:hypothetical protein